MHRIALAVNDPGLLRKVRGIEGMLMRKYFVDLSELKLEISRMNSETFLLYLILKINFNKYVYLDLMLFEFRNVFHNDYLS